MKSKSTLDPSADPQHMRALLQEGFAKAGIPLQWADSVQQFDRRIQMSAGTPLFMMDVRRIATRNRVKERILIHFGNGTEVRVVGVDSQKQQVVLRVHEPRSQVVVRRWDQRQKRHLDRVDIIPERTRSLLVGMDECHLFVCPLERNASSVREAHRKLQPDVLTDAPASQRKRTRRQGEWFFIPVEDSVVLNALEEVCALIGPNRHVPVDPGADPSPKMHLRWFFAHSGPRPHIVDERIRMNNTTYVRGRVRHPDHHVLKLHGWHEVHLNTEETSARIQGMTWVD